MIYEFATAARIVVGAGAAGQLPDLVAGVGRAALVVHGRGAAARGGPAADAVRLLAERGLVGASFAAGDEPDVASVEAAAALARSFGCDCVVGIGGGSVLDTAKAAAALAANEGGALRYMEVVGEGRPLEHPPLPVLAAPTTAGTGSEVTRNAVVASREHRAKASIRHAGMLPRVALVDPLLTLDMPPALTASTGMDALTQLLEAFVSRRASALTDGLCREGLERTAWALRRAYERPDDVAARQAMSEASLMSGVALANAGLGAVHGVAAPLGGSYPAPHGAACAALLPHVTAANVASLRRQDPGAAALGRYARAAAVLTRRADAAAEDLAGALSELVLALGIPGLARYGLAAADVPALAEMALRASSTRTNPATLSRAELSEAIAAAL